MQGNELIEANLADAHAILSEVREICEGMAAGRLSPGRRSGSAGAPGGEQHGLPAACHGDRCPGVYRCMTICHLAEDWLMAYHRAMAKTNYSITREQVLEHLDYNPESGVITYRTAGHKRSAGDQIKPRENVINILGSSYSKLKLIWFMVTGEWPAHKVNPGKFGSNDSSWESLSGTRDRDLTQARLKEVLSYDPDTGVFHWLEPMNSQCKAGSAAGTKDDRGYMLIRVDGKLYLAHRLAHLHMTGSFPDELIDHKNMIKSDNRWVNLRSATKSENGQNRLRAQSNNVASGLLGVYWSDQRQAWGAKVVVGGRQIFAGFHETPELAHACVHRGEEKTPPVRDVVIMLRVIFHWLIFLAVVARIFEFILTGEITMPDVGF